MHVYMYVCCKVSKSSDKGIVNLSKKFINCKTIVVSTLRKMRVRSFTLAQLFWVAILGQWIFLQKRYNSDFSDKS